jgi:hypothetical protein
LAFTVPDYGFIVHIYRICNLFFGNLDKDFQKRPQKIEVTNPVILKGEVVANQKPPPPAPPPVRQIKEDRTTPVDRKPAPPPKNGKTDGQ